MNKKSSRIMYASAEELYKLKAEHYQMKYEALKSLIIDIRAVMRPINNSSGTMIEQINGHLAMIEKDEKDPTI